MDRLLPPGGRAEGPGHAAAARYRGAVGFEEIEVITSITSSITVSIGKIHWVIHWVIQHIYIYKIEDWVIQ